LRHAGWLKFEQVRSGIVDTGDQEANAVGAFAVMLSIGLSAITDGGNSALDGEGATIGETG